MNEIIDPRDRCAMLAATTTEDLRNQLADALSVTAENLAHLADIWVELERRGEDLSALRSGVAVYLPLIAEGHLDSRLVVRYAGQTMLLRHLADLPKEDQAMLVENDVVVVVDFENEEFVEREVQLGQLHVKLIAQVLNNRIVPPEEQRRKALRRSRPGKATSFALAPQAPAPTPAPQAFSFSALARDVDILRDRSGRRSVLAVEMSADEHQQLKEKARLLGVPMSHIVRAALVHAEILDRKPSSRPRLNSR